MKFKKLINVKKLSLQQWRWLIVAYWKLLWVQFRLLRAKGSVHHLIQGKNVKQHHLSQMNVQRVAEQMFESIRLAARCHLWQPACLPRSLVLVDMLKKYEIEAELKIGVSKEEQSFASHAWVEIAGEVVGEINQIKEKFVKIVEP